MHRLYILAAILLLSLISCNESGLGIFYSISQEQPLEDTTLPNTLSVSDMVKGSKDYYVCAGGLYSRDISSGQNSPWDDEVKTPSAEYSLCINLVEFSGSFYGLFSNTAGNSTKIYKSPRDTISWSSVGTFDDPIVALTASETAIFVTERTDYATYATRMSTDGSDYSTTIDLPEQHTGVTDAADFLSLTWLVSGSKLYSGTGSTYEIAAGTNAPSSSSGFGGVYSSGELARLFVSNSEGEIYCTSDGLTWDSSFVEDSAGSPVELFDIEGLSVIDAEVIVVGAKNGYYDIVFEDGYSSSFSLQIPGSEEAGDFSSSDANFLNIDLRTSVIRGFFFDEQNNTLFAFTSGNGLWINPISGSAVESLTRKWDRQ